MDSLPNQFRQNPKWIMQALLILHRAIFNFIKLILSFKIYIYYFFNLIIYFYVEQ